LRLDDDVAAHKARVREAVDVHAATIAGIERRMSRATARCDPQLLA
jgi:hypothetical protein